MFWSIFLYKLKKRKKNFYDCWLFFFFFCLFGATPIANGGSQARGQLGIVAAGHSNAGSKPRLECIHHSSWQHQILSSLSKPGIEPVSSWILVRFISTEPWWELPIIGIFIAFLLKHKFILKWEKTEEYTKYHYWR